MLRKKRRFVAITTLIDKDIVISGDTTYVGGIRLDGIVKGKLEVLGKEDSLLIMGHGSEVHGDVVVHKAIINGKINGNIKSVDYLELNADAIINGNIEYGIIEIHEGAIVNGTLKCKKIAKKIAKKNNKKGFKEKFKKNLQMIISNNIIKKN